ncbi:NADPH:quinone reductase-like Zn-dependent oxidoreductase [Bradyrhizobium sp. USDA 4369]
MLADFGSAVAHNVHTPMPEQDVFAELRRLSIKSPGLRIFNIHTYDHDLPQLRKLARELITLLAEGRISPSTGARLPMTDIVQAHRMFEAGSTLGKIVILP